jgi:hypothetical protein
MVGERALRRHQETVKGKEGTEGETMTMKYTRFKEGEEPQVLTTVSEECDAGACEKCPGILHDEEYPQGQVLAL